MVTDRTKINNTFRDNKQKKMNATDVASPTLPHLAGVAWRLEVPRASRASAALPQSAAEGPSPVYSVRLSLAHVHPTPFAATAKGTNSTASSASADAESAANSGDNNNNKTDGAKQQPLMQVKLEDVSFSCTPETLLALADAIEAAVKQSEQAPYRRILRLIR